MTTTTSLKLPDDLKCAIAKVAAFEGKTAHALMVDTLQSAIEDAMARQQFYTEAQASYRAALQSNAVFGGADVKAYVMGRAKGDKSNRPIAQPLNPAQPIHSADD